MVPKHYYAFQGNVTYKFTKKLCSKTLAAIQFQIA